MFRVLHEGLRPLTSSIYLLDRYKVTEYKSRTVTASYSNVIDSNNGVTVRASHL
jgi:hypothetical protein